MKQAYETIANEQYRITGEVDMQRAYQIIDHYTSQPDEPNHSRAGAQIPYDGLRAASELRLAAHIRQTLEIWQQETLPFIIETCNASGWGSAQ